MARHSGKSNEYDYSGLITSMQTTANEDFMVGATVDDKVFNKNKKGYGHSVMNY